MSNGVPERCARGDFIPEQNPAARTGVGPTPATGGPLPLDKPFPAAKLSGVTKLLSVLVLALFVSDAARADSLPSRDPQVVVPLLRAWHEHDGYARLTHILGRPDSDIGSGIFIWVFRLNDGTSVYASAAQRDRLISINRRAPGGLAQKLYQPIAHDLDRSQPSSAPF